MLAAQRAGVAPGRCLVVEDSPTGVQAARAATLALLIYPLTARWGIQGAAWTLVLLAVLSVAAAASTHRMSEAQE